MGIWQYHSDTVLLEDVKNISILYLDDKQLVYSYRNEGSEILQDVTGNAMRSGILWIASPNFTFLILPNESLIISSMFKDRLFKTVMKDSDEDQAQSYLLDPV